MKQRRFCYSIEMYYPYFAKILYCAEDSLPAGSPMLSFSGVQPFPVWTDVVFRSIFQDPFKKITILHNSTIFTW